MILFLDDDPARAALAYQRWKPSDREQVIWCQTAEEAIITLQDYRDRLTYVSLGHDLGGLKNVHTAREECGMEIVRHLEKLAKKGLLGGLKDARYRIHTWNADAGNVMYRRLKGVGLRVEFIPFGM